MGKSYKIILSCVCVVFVLLGFGIGRITDTVQATDSNQNTNASNTESEDRDSSPKNNVNNTEGEEGNIKIIITQDGKEWTINVDPSISGGSFDWDNFDNFDWSNYDIGITGDHE